MPTSSHQHCGELAKQAVFDLQNQKATTSSIVRKLELISELIGDKELSLWCAFQLGSFRSTLPKPEQYEAGESYANRLILAVNKLGLVSIYSAIIDRADEHGGGFNSVEMIETVLTGIQKSKRGQSGDMYLHNIVTLLSKVRNDAAKRAAKLYSIHALGGIPTHVFDTIRDRVDELLLEICPEAVEKFMTAYNSLSSGSPENWSLALTCSRRVIKAVADALFPPTDSKIGGRSLNEDNYINRLWAFLDENAAAGSEKSLAKAHVDYLGTFLQRLNDKACKGVHANVELEEASKAVLYTYLTLGDILEFAGPSVKKTIAETKGVLNINTASLLQLVEGGLTMDQSKEVIKIRSKKPFQSLDELSSVKGLGKSTIAKLRQKFLAL